MKGSPKQKSQLGKLCYCFDLVPPIAIHSLLHVVNLLNQGLSEVGIANAEPLKLLLATHGPMATNQHWSQEAHGEDYFRSTILPERKSKGVGLDMAGPKRLDFEHNVVQASSGPLSFPKCHLDPCRDMAK